jgi:hypothetical protein
MLELIAEACRQCATGGLNYYLCNGLMCNQQTSIAHQNCCTLLNIAGLGRLEEIQDSGMVARSQTGFCIL